MVSKTQIREGSSSPQAEAGCLGLSLQLGTLIRQDGDRGASGSEG